MCIYIFSSTYLTRFKSSFRSSLRAEDVLGVLSTRVLCGVLNIDDDPFDSLKKKGSKSVKNKDLKKELLTQFQDVQYCAVCSIC